MNYMLKTDYNEFVNNITFKAERYPPITMQKELDKHPLKYLGWAIWIKNSLKPPTTELEQASLNMVDGYLNRNLSIVDSFPENATPIGEKGLIKC